jgi:ATP-dependent helicase/nuclease subunit B
MGGFSQVSLEETLSLARTYSQEYANEHFSQLDSGRMEYLFTKNMRELDFIVEELWDELRQSKFLPAAFELNFGIGGQMPPIEFSGSTMPARLRGFVDRVDVYQAEGKRYFRVVDYKTGKKSFDYCDVFNGIGLQMLLYLFALDHGAEALIGEDRIAAGVQYFPARAPYLSMDSASSDPGKERNKTHVRSGLLLADGEALAAMDPLEGMPRLPCKVNKDGQITGDLADGKQLAQLQSYVMQVLRKMVDDIASGNITANPYTRGNAHNACDYCPYISLCKGNDSVQRRDYKEMSAQRFWEEIEKEMNDRG